MGGYVFQLPVVLWGNAKRRRREAPPFDLAPPLATMTRSYKGCIPFQSAKRGSRPRRNGLGCHKTERPGWTAPCMIVVCRICHASPARGVFQTADGFGCIAPQYRCPWRAGAYRRDSPSSLWEGVSKFHYPPRCPRARFASTGSKAALIARPACPSPPELAVVAAHLTSLSRGFRIGNTVYSVFKARKKTPLTYQEVSGANVLPLTEIFSKYFS